MTTKNPPLFNASAMRRRQFIAVAAAATSLGLSGPLSAQPAEFPNKLVTIVVPFPAGGNLDAISRAVAQPLSEKWKVPVVIDNRSGAGGMIGADRVVKARDDGHTLLFTNTSVIQTPALQSKPPYDALKDLTAVTQLGTVAIAFAIPASSPAKTLREYVDLVKSQPGKHAYGTYGVGSSAHLLTEGFRERNGLDMQHVAYRSEAAAMQDLLGGRIGSGWFSERVADEQQRGGNVRVLGVIGTVRSSVLTETPTFTEAGFAGMEQVGWFGVFASGGTSKSHAEMLARDINAALRRPDIQAVLKQRTVRSDGASTPDEFARVLVAEDKLWRGYITQFGIKAE